MGLWSWFFPSTEDRVALAKQRMKTDRWADARLELMDIDTPEAIELLQQCEQHLAQMNLDAAVSWCEAGDDGRVEHHLEVAQNFHSKALEPAFKDARRQMRTIREQRIQTAKRAAEADQARLRSGGPGDASGNASWRDSTMPAEFIDSQGDEAASRLALIVEGYPVELRRTVGDLGGDFARALIDFENARPDLALQALLALPDTSPVIRFERARTAYALEDPAAAAKELRAFAKLHGSHAPMGHHHTGSFLALCLVESGDPVDALSVMRKVRVDAPKEGGALFAQLLEINGKLDEAESELLGLIRSHPKDSSLYKMLARIQVTKNDRMKAMTVLEKSLQATTCSPGTCGHRPPDLGVIRTLAQLYLEDRVDLERGLELAEQAQQLIQQPTWEDAYLQALAAERGGHPQATRMLTGLAEHTPPGSPQEERITRFLTGPAPSAS